MFTAVVSNQFKFSILVQVQPEGPTIVLPTNAEAVLTIHLCMKHTTDETGELGVLGDSCIQRPEICTTGYFESIISWTLAKNG